MFRMGRGLLGLAAAALLAACVSAVALGASQATTAATLTLYSSQHEGMTNAIVKAFERESGVSVRVRFGEDEGLASQIAVEGSSSPADVVLTENTPPLVLLEEKKLLAKVAPATLRKVPAQYNSLTGGWVGVAGRATALVYNPKLVATTQLPASLLDLAKPAWKGKLAISPSEADFQPVVAAVIKLKGRAAAKAWLAGFAKNAKVYNDNEGIIEGVERGRIAAAVIDHYYWFQAENERGVGKMQSKLHYFGKRDPGALIDVSAAAALASSKNPALAQKFLAFLVSRGGQQTLTASRDWEYPLARGMAAAPRLKPFASIKPPALRVAHLGDGSSALTLLREVGRL